MISPGVHKHRRWSGSREKLLIPKSRAISDHETALSARDRVQLVIALCKRSVTISVWLFSDLPAIKADEFWLQAGFRHVANERRRRCDGKLRRQLGQRARVNQVRFMTILQIRNQFLLYLYALATQSDPENLVVSRGTRKAGNRLCRHVRSFLTEHRNSKRIKNHGPASQKPARAVLKARVTLFGIMLTRPGQD